MQNIPLEFWDFTSTVLQNDKKGKFDLGPVKDISLLLLQTPCGLGKTFRPTSSGVPILQFCVKAILKLKYAFQKATGIDP